MKDICERKAEASATVRQVACPAIGRTDPETRSSTCRRSSLLAAAHTRTGSRELSTPFWIDALPCLNASVPCGAFFAL